MVVTVEAREHDDLLWGNEGTLIRVWIVAFFTSCLVELNNLAHAVILRVKQHNITLVTVIATVASQNHDFSVVEGDNSWIVSG